MANPRQRRKARSSAHRNVKTTNAKKQRKHPAIKGPEILKKAWDVRKTVRQNYAALGLAPNLANRQSGGTEDKAAALKPIRPLEEVEIGQDEDVIIQETAPVPAEAGSSTSAKGTKPLRKGFGRIVRDEKGNVVDVVLPEDEEDGEQEEVSAEEAGDVEMDVVAGAGMNEKREKSKRKAKAKAGEEMPWGAPMEDWVPDSAEVAEEVVGRQKTKHTAVTEELEKLAAEGTKLARHASAQEVQLLRQMLEKHGDDVRAMSRDGKLNRWQKTEGELRRAIKKAGGAAAVLAAPAQ